MHVCVPPNSRIRFLFNHYNKLNADHTYLKNHASTLNEATWDQSRDVALENGVHSTQKKIHE